MLKENVDEFLKKEYPNGFLILTIPKDESIELHLHNPLFAEQLFDVYERIVELAEGEME